MLPSQEQASLVGRLYAESHNFNQENLDYLWLLGFEMCREMA
jgi:hypothetical protein